MRVRNLRSCRKYTRFGFQIYTEGSVEIYFGWYFYIVILRKGPRLKMLENRGLRRKFMSTNQGATKIGRLLACMMKAFIIWTLCVVLLRQQKHVDTGRDMQNAKFCTGNFTGVLDLCGKVLGQLEPFLNCRVWDLRLGKMLIDLDLNSWVSFVTSDILFEIDSCKRDSKRLSNSFIVSLCIVVSLLRKCNGKL